MELGKNLVDKFLRGSDEQIRYIMLKESPGSRSIWSRGKYDESKNYRKLDEFTI